MNNLGFFEEKPLSDYLEDGGDEKCLYFPDSAIVLRAKITSKVY